MSVRGGKRLRVVFLHAALVTDDPAPGLDEAAISVELLQTHGLIHDDIIDGSTVRRGAPSVHQAYRDEFPDGPGTALGLATLAGDLAAFPSLRVLLTAGCRRTGPPPRPPSSRTLPPSPSSDSSSTWNATSAPCPASPSSTRSPSARPPATPCSPRCASG